MNRKGVWAETGEGRASTESPEEERGDYEWMGKLGMSAGENVLSPVTEHAAAKTHQP